MRKVSIRQNPLLRAAAHVLFFFLQTVGLAEVLTVTGLGLVTAGLWMISVPMALIVCGSILLWIGVPPRPSFIDRPAKKDERR